MSIALIIIFLVIFNKFLLWIQKKVSSPGSDHPYHLGLINGIRENKNRFIKSYPNIIGEKNFAYPQFLHFVLSFVSQSFLKKHYSFIGEILNFLSLILYLVFIIWVYLIIKPNILIDNFVLYCGLLYILTPFSWAIWNSKNTGISARGLGVLLGFAYQFLVTMYFISGNYIILFFIFSLVFVVLLSSQFAFQYIVLSSPFYAFFYNSIIWVVMPVLAGLIFYILMPRVASNFFKGQYWHKKIYFLHLSKVFILKARPSIYRDFVWDFWINLKKNYKVRLLYIYHNPIVTVFIAIPIFSFLMIKYILNPITIWNGIEQDFVYHIIIGLALFLLTSFRQTRFLGEPERYLEFAIPYIVLTFIVFSDDNSLWLFMLLGISSLLILFQFCISYFIKTNVDKRSNNFSKINSVLRNIENDNEELRIFSNNEQILKYLLNDKYRVLKPNLTSKYTGKFLFKDIFRKKYPEIDESVIVPLIKEFNINCFILDTSIYSLLEISHFDDLNFVVTNVSTHFVIYKSIKPINNYDD